MLRLRMETQPLRYEINNQPAKLQLQTKQAELHMETQAATVEITPPRGTLTIDHTPWRYSLGLKNNSDLVRDAANAGKQSALEAVARIAQEGRRLSQIENGGNPIADMAREATQPPRANLSLQWLQPPSITYDLQPVRFNPQPGHVRYTVIPGSVSNQTQPGSITVQITQYPSLRIWTESTGENVDLSY